MAAQEREMETGCNRVSTGRKSSLNSTSERCSAVTRRPEVQQEAVGDVDWSVLQEHSLRVCDLVTGSEGCVCMLHGSSSTLDDSVEVTEKIMELSLLQASPIAGSLVLVELKRLSRLKGPRTATRKTLSRPYTRTSQVDLEVRGGMIDKEFNLA
ncbi:hypothetical protein PsorP6_012823 [Peronosclerospora sorghi]|uniref:Uncharacterized protein n=1 Tax=Peronosclerospora sorghi TaxID=230839 RepID=A0ACC0WF42_9STRA|nr:hypothetical protein PsorP6_012823 [Peronosclerospora sorghi]